MAEEKQKTEEKDQGVPSWLLPILTGLASLGGNYILWVKPLQDAFKTLNDQIEELREEVKELKRQRKKEEDLDGLEEDELLHLNRNRSLSQSKRKKNIASLR